MIVIYERVKDFYEKTRQFLLQREAVSQLLIANALRNIEEMSTPERFFGCAIDEQGEYALMFCSVHPFNLCVYSMGSPQEDYYIKELAQYLHTHNLPIKGITAKDTLCMSFLETYQALSHQEVKLELAMDIMELKKLSPINLAKGSIRKASLNELDLITRWEILFAKEALNKDVEEGVLERVRKKIELGIIYLYFNEQDEPVSMLNAARKLENGMVFNEIYTPVRYRGKGYAQTNVHLASKMYLEQGNQFCALFVDKTNPISNRVYEKVGYEIIENCYAYQIM